MSAALRYLLLAAPGLVGLLGLAWALEPADAVKLASLTLMGPYILGASKLYEAYAIRKTQRALLVLVPAALQAVDKVLPGLIAQGGSPGELREQVRAELARMTNVNWQEADQDTLIESALQEMAQRFDPFVFTEHACTRRAAIEKAIASDTLSEPYPA